MPTPTSSVSFLNRPTDRPGIIQQIDPIKFDQLTSTQDFPLPNERVQGGTFGESTPIDIKRRGIMSKLVHVLECTVTVSGNSGGGNTVTARDAWWQGMLKRYVLRANSTNLFNCRGEDLHALWQIMAKKPGSGEIVNTISPGNVANGTYTLRAIWEVPVAIDENTLVGSVFTDSSQTNIVAELTWANKVEMFDLAGTGDVAITNAVVKTMTTRHDVKTVQTEKGLYMPLPDLRFVHQLHTVEHVVPSGGGEHPFEMSSVDGNLVRTLVQWRNGSGAGQGAYDPATFNRIGFRFGQNVHPTNYSPAYLLTRRNEGDYRGRISEKFVVLDNTTRNAVREALDPHGVADPEVLIDFGTSLTVQGTNRLYLGQQALTRAGQFEQIPVAGYMLPAPVPATTSGR